MKIISGGQTGADEAALSAALKSGFETGGHAPKGWKTVHGPNPLLGSKYGLVEDKSTSYPPRTLKNVQNADATIRLAVSFKSPGERLTLKYVNQQNKPLLDVDILKPPDPRKVALWIHRERFQTVNVAGNADRSNTEIFDFVENYMITVFEILKTLTAEKYLK